MTQAAGMALDGSSTSVMMAHSNTYHSHMSDYYSRKVSSTPDVVPSGVTERKMSPSDRPDMMALDVIHIKDSGKSMFTRSQSSQLMYNCSVQIVCKLLFYIV